MKTAVRSFIFIAIFFCLFDSANKSYAQGILSSVEQKFSTFKELAPKERVQIITDRNFYAPGEVIWIYAAVYKIQSPEISTLSNEVQISLISDKNMEIYNKKVMLTEGTGDGFLRLPTGLNDGVYYIQGKTTNSGDINYYFKRVVIKKNIIPQFLINVRFAEKAYLPGDEVTLTLEFLDFYNEPMRNIKYTVQYFDGENILSEISSAVKKEGMVEQKVTIPSNLKSELFTYHISAESKGVLAELSGDIPLQSDNVFIEFYPENGKLIDSIASKINFYTYDVYGKPVVVEANLMESDKVLSTISSNQSGMGSFVLNPVFGKTYTVKLKGPSGSDTGNQLPEVAKNGVALKLNKKSSTQLAYQLVSSYQDPRHIYMVGVSDGEIFWTSDHMIDKELNIDIDLSKATGKIAHFVVLNAAMLIEGEHVVLLNGNAPIPVLALDSKSSDSSPSGKMEFDIKPPAQQKGDLIVTTVNSPWIIKDLPDQPVFLSALPFDIGRQMIFQSEMFYNSEFSELDLEKFLPYYVPFDFGWEKVLKTPGAYSNYDVNSLVSSTRALNDRLSYSYRVEVAGGIILNTNQTSDVFFAASNPSYISSLQVKKTERVPAYKNMLESGSSLLDVIQSIKPFNLKGDDIIFMGTASSLNAQGGALIVMDGINRGTSASILNNISPFDVEKIFVSTNPVDIQRYTGLNSVGLIEITLKTGENLREEADQFDENGKFVSPEFEKNSKDYGPDYRSTLLWNVKPITGDETENSIEILNSDLISNVIGKIYFIPIHGVPATKQFEYMVK